MTAIQTMSLMAVVRNTVTHKGAAKLCSPKTRSVTQITEKEANPDLKISIKFTFSLNAKLENKIKKINPFFK